MKGVNFLKCLEQMGVNTCHFKASLTLCRVTECIKFWDNLTTIDPFSMEFEYFKTYIASTMKIFQETIKRDVDELLQLLLLPLLDSIDR